MNTQTLPCSPLGLADHLVFPGASRPFASPRVFLPDFQRDAVWSPSQVCELWDSLLRGIPIPSLIIGRYTEASLIGKPDAKDGTPLQPRDGDYFLIDGQQRSRALLAALERIHVPQSTEEKIESPPPLAQRLWLDLNWPHDRSEPHDDPSTENLDGWGLRFGFFLCTQARPWGHDRARTGRPNPNKVLAAREQLFESGLYPDFSRQGTKKGCFDFELPLEHTWPVEARCPVPFKDILDHSQKNGAHTPQSWEHFLQGERNKFKKHLCSQKELGGKWGFQEPSDETLKRVAEQLNNALENLKTTCISSIVVDLNEDELLPAFQRINSNGSNAKNEELFFSAIKREEPACDALARKAGATFPTLDVVRGAVIHVTQPQPENPAASTPRPRRERGEETPPIELSPNNLRTLGKTVGGKKNLSTKLKDELANQHGRFKTALDELTEILKYRPALDPKDPGIPEVMLPLLSFTSWLPPVAWLIAWRKQGIQTSGNRDNLSASERARLLRYVLIDHFFADWNPDPAPMLRDLLDYVSQEGKANNPFPEICEIRKQLGVYEKKNASGAPAWLRKVDDDAAPNGRLVLPSTPTEWTTFQERWLAKNNGWVPDAGTYGGLLASRGEDLLMWSQRQAMHDWFSPHATVIAQLDKIGKPWDADHIVPSSFFDGRKANCLTPNELAGANLTAFSGLKNFKLSWDNIKIIANRFGNKRLWPSGFNRSDQAAPAGDKLADKWLAGRPDWEVLSQWANSAATSGNAIVSSASSIDRNSQLSFWDQTPIKDPQKAVTWEVGSLRAFLEASIVPPVGREHAIYQELFAVLEPGLRCHPDWKHGTAGDRYQSASSSDVQEVSDGPPSLP